MGQWTTVSALDFNLKKKKKPWQIVNRFVLWKHTKASSMSVNKRGTNRGSRVQTQIGCSLLGETIAQMTPWRTCDAPCVARNRQAARFA